MVIHEWKYLHCYVGATWRRVTPLKRDNTSWKKYENVDLSEFYLFDMIWAGHEWIFWPFSRFWHVLRDPGQKPTVTLVGFFVSYLEYLVGVDWSKDSCAMIFVLFLPSSFCSKFCSFCSTRKRLGPWPEGNPINIHFSFFAYLPLRFWFMTPFSPVSLAPLWPLKSDNLGKLQIAKIILFFPFFFVVFSHYFLLFRLRPLLLRRKGKAVCHYNPIWLLKILKILKKCVSNWQSWW